MALRIWQLKALIQKAFSTMPFGEGINYWFQRRPKGKLSREGKGLHKMLANAKLHLDAVAHFSPRSPSECVFFEFGSGWDLAGPIALWCLGVNHQICIDIVCHLRFHLLNQVIAGLSSLPPLDVKRLPFQPVNSLDELRRYYGVEYIAPCDSRSSGLPDACIDVATSTYTLEHVPAHDVLTIFLHLSKLLRDGGLMSHIIDYQDHYSYFDPKITRYNFLQYNSVNWRWFNSSLHFQSRLRHKDYITIQRRAGFRCLQDSPRLAPQNLEEIRRIKIAEEFRCYSIEELAVRSAHIVATISKQ